MWDEQEIELELLERTREPLDVLSVGPELLNKRSLKDHSTRRTAAWQVSGTRYPVSPNSSALALLRPVWLFVGDGDLRVDVELYLAAATAQRCQDCLRPGEEAVQRDIFQFPASRCLDELQRASLVSVG